MLVQNYMKQTIQKKYTIRFLHGIKIFFTILCVVLSSTADVYGATISFDVPQKIRVGSQVAVDVVVDTEGESINSADIRIKFPSEIVTFTGYDTKNNVLSLWVTPPTIPIPGEVHFSGIIPGGVERLYDPQNPQNKNIIVATLFFTATTPGAGDIVLGNSELLRNDGLGTPIDIVPIATSITTTGTGGEGTSISDTEPPFPFTVQIIEKSSHNKTPRLALFAANDEASGISRYEARRNSGPWHSISSPHPLPWNFFGYRLTIRAFDFSGNYRDQSIVIGGKDPYKVVPIGVLLVLTIVFFVYRRKKSVIHE